MTPGTQRSRRSFLLGAAGAALLAGCGDTGEPDTPAPTTTEASEADKADVAVLNTALEFELMAVAAYSASASSLDDGERLLAHEREHAEELASAIRSLGGTPSGGQASFGDPPREDPRRFFVDLENAAIALYLDLLPKVSDPELRGLVAAILTAEAEHLTVLSGAADAFVVGRA